MQEYGDAGCLPVVALDDIRIQPQEGDAGEDSFGIEGKSLCVISLAVNAVAAEVKFVVDKIDLFLGPAL